MTADTPTKPRPPAGLSWIAIATGLAFGCATVRAPASMMREAVPVTDGVPEPQLELWIESARTVSPEESARATAEARAALDRALAGRTSLDGDAILVVRAQGVTRTPSRRAEQNRAAVAGVVGAVVAVAAVVTAIVVTRGRGGHSKPSAPQAPTRASAVAPAPHGSAVAPAPRFVTPSRPVPGAPARPLPYPAPRPTVAPIAPHYGGYGGWSFDVGVSWGFEIGPVAPPPPLAEPPLEPPPPPPAFEPPDDWESEPPAVPEVVDAVRLAPPSPMPLDDRGFFAGDELTLELTVVDRHTGAPRWTKVVHADVDPRDARAVKDLLDRSLAEPQGWVAAGAWPEGA